MFSRTSFLGHALAVLCAVIVCACVHAANPVPENPFAAPEALKGIRYTFPDSSWPNTLPPLCAMARDLPLLRESGANAVYTRGAPPEDGDHIFLNLLSSTKLTWIAAYPLPLDVDPDLPLLEQRDLVLSRFDAFAQRFQGNGNLRAVVLDFGTQHLVESALLAPEFAAILDRYFPVDTPLLGHVAYSPESLYIAPTGVDFWLYRFIGTPPTTLDKSLLAQRTPLPILFDLSQIANDFVADETTTWKGYFSLFTAGAPPAHVLALDLIGNRETTSSSTVSSDGGSTTTTSVVGYRKDALFVGRRNAGAFEDLVPTPFSAALREVWQAKPIEDHAAPPILSTLLNAATLTGYLSPGTRIAFEGSLLSAEASPASSDDWPLHAGAKCLCIADRPVSIGMLSSKEGSAQLPWLLSTGTVAARFVREGTASEPILLDVLDLSPGIYPRRIGRGDSGCSIDDSGGVKPGETIEIEATGAGPLNGDLTGIEVLLNDTPTEVLYAGLSPDSVGLAKLRVKLPQVLQPSERHGLFLRKGARASNLIPIDFVGDARPTVGLVADRERILVQPGGLSAPLRIDTRGLNGYCGSVSFTVEGLPNGVTSLIGPVEAGKPATLQLKADGFAKVREDQPIYLYAIPTPGDLAILALKLRVMPQMGEMALTLESRGFPAGASAAITWNGEVLHPTGAIAARGLYLQLIDGRTGIFYPVERYDLWESKEESNRLEVRLNSLRSGIIVAMAIADEATLHMQPSLRNWIQTKLGSAAIATLGYQNSWAIVSKVGATSPIAELASETGPAVVETVLVLPEK